MPLANIDHYFVYTRDLESSKEFYSKVLGFEVGPRPPFNFKGYWLYLEGRARVHLGLAEEQGQVQTYLDGPATENAEHTGRLDHIAFQASDFKKFRQHLDDLGILYRHREVPQFKLQQLFIKDPDGVTLELNFPSDES